MMAMAMAMAMVVAMVMKSFDQYSYSTLVVKEANAPNLLNTCTLNTKHPFNNLGPPTSIQL